MYTNLPERRKCMRVDSSIPVHYRGYEHYIDTISKDIGEQGLKFTTNRFLPVFTKLVIDVCLFSDAEPARILTEIVWIRKLPHMDLYCIGAKFLDISDKHRKLICRYLEVNISDTS